MPPSVIATASSPSPSPRASATSNPATTKKAGLAGAIAVVRRYYRIANNLHHHMDANAIAALFTPHCLCQAQVRAIRTAEAKHEHYTDHASINAIVPSVESARRADVLADINVSQNGLVRANGSRVTSAPPRRHIRRVFRLELFGSKWLITRIEVA